MNAIALADKPPDVRDNLPCEAPFDYNDPSWIARFSHIFMHPDNYEKLVYQFFPMPDALRLTRSYFFSAEVHTDARFPRYNKHLVGGLWVEDKAQMAMFGIRKGEEWKWENDRILKEIAGYLGNDLFAIDGKVNHALPSL